MADEDRLGDSVSGFDTTPREPSIEMFRQAQAVKRREGTLAAGGPMDPSAREMLDIPPVSEQQATLAPRDTRLGGVPIERGFEGIRDMLFPIGENVPARPTLPLPGLRREADLMGALDLLSNVADAGAPAATKAAVSKAGIPLAALMARTAKGAPDLRRPADVIEEVIPGAVTDVLTGSERNSLADVIRSLEQVGADFENYGLPASVTGTQRKFAQKMLDKVEDISLPLMEGVPPEKFTDSLFGDLLDAMNDPKARNPMLQNPFNLPVKLSKEERSKVLRERIGLHSVPKPKGK
jgi:hypothetical protein